MDVKDRVIRIGRKNHSISETDCFIVDEYGIEGGEIYHRDIAISENIYEEFKKKPDDEILLDEFLECNDINKEWKRYKLSMPIDENGMENSSRLFDDIDLENTQKEFTELSEQTKSKVYKKIYYELSKKETLINNPLIMDVFNEALREDSGLANRENVFPFFDEKNY